MTISTDLLIGFIVFSIIYLCVTNWFQLRSFLSIVVGPKYRTSSVDDKWIKSTVKKKTGLSLLNITIFHEKRMYGMMAGLPFWPKLILSGKLYRAFNKDELEWVILHEAGHCVLWHNLQTALIELLFLSFGIYTIWILNIPLIIIPLHSIFLSFITVQIIRWGIEYMADRFSIKRVNNPKGVITAQEKLRNAYSKGLFSEKSILRFLFRWNIYPSRRIMMANDRLGSKK